MSLIAFAIFNVVASSIAIVAVAVYGVARALRTAGWEPARALARHRLSRHPAHRLARSGVCTYLEWRLDRLRRALADH